MTLSGHTRSIIYFHDNGRPSKSFLILTCSLSPVNEHGMYRSAKIFPGTCMNISVYDRIGCTVYGYCIEHVLCNTLTGSGKFRANSMRYFIYEICMKRMYLKSIRKLRKLRKLQISGYLLYTI